MPNRVPEAFKLPFSHVITNNRPLSGTSSDKKDWDVYEVIEGAIDKGYIDIPQDASSITIYEVADISARDTLTGLSEGDVAVITDSDGSDNQGVSFYDGSSWTNPIVEGSGSAGSNIVVLEDHAAMKAYSGLATMAIIRDPDMGGTFYITSNLVGTRNGGTVYLNTAGTLHFNISFN